MTDEKLVESLGDLRNAASVAAQQGVCKIRLSSGETYSLCPIPSDAQTPVVTDPQEPRGIPAYPTPGGKTFSGEQLKEEFKRRVRERGPGGAGVAP